MRNSMPLDTAKLHGFLKNPTSEQKENLAVGGTVEMNRGLQIIEVCKHPSLSGLRQVFYEQAVAETKQCKVQVGLSSIDEFKKVTENKWVSTAGPGGACHTGQTTTLERPSKTSLSWTWTDVTSTADSSELCKKFGVTQSVNKPLIFAERSGPFPMHCEVVSFGHRLI